MSGDEPAAAFTFRLNTTGSRLRCIDEMAANACQSQALGGHSNLSKKYNQLEAIFNSRRRSGMRCEDRA
ncbi:hypothetical protein GO998_22840 (plasmid) [Ralstonia syzygii]|uniref:Uncharacterized protein n=1 Tax=Ralstonia syzygii TaxID=28097 RepID=A0ABX7ZNG5_9RALS|nr:hypothetical protein [Ralstonia syzygii]QUP56507.1 hypothetical protein GO998_22840 [Ralstonia syzygii]